MRISSPTLTRVIKSKRSKVIIRKPSLTFRPSIAHKIANKLWKNFSSNRKSLVAHGKVVLDEENIENFADKSRTSTIENVFCLITTERKTQIIASIN
jgi:hypothetical protein